MKNSRIRKLDFVKLIGNDLNHSIAYFHIYSVISILVEELIEELKTSKQFRIINFGVFKLVELKSKIIKDITGITKQTHSTNALRFKLSRRLVDYLKGK